MILQFEFSQPFQPKPKTQVWHAMKRIYWLWFSIAYYPVFDINSLTYCFIDIGRKQQKKRVDELESAIHETIGWVEDTNALKTEDGGETLRKLKKVMHNE